MADRQVSRLLQRGRVLASLKAPSYGFDCAPPLRRSITYMPRPGDGTPRTVTLIPGEDTAVEVMKAMHAPLSFEVFEMNGKMDKVPDEVLNSIRKNKVCLKGGLTTPVGGGVSSLNLQLRKELDLYASLVHCFNLPRLLTRHENVDIVVIRENMEGEYSGLEHEVIPGVVESLKVLKTQHTQGREGAAMQVELQDGQSGFKSMEWLGTNQAIGNLRMTHWIASSNSRQWGSYRTRITKDFYFKGVSGNRPRFYSGGPAVLTLIGANIAVYLMWYKVEYIFMCKNFMISLQSIFSRRYHTLITSSFSHASTSHLLLNMFGLLCFGGLLEGNFGARHLILHYLGAGVAGSLGHLIYYVVIYPIIKKISPDDYRFEKTPAALGASGAVTSLTIFYILLHPTHQMFLFFVPMPAAAVGCILIGRDVYLAIKGGSGISVGGHLGGALHALLVYGTMKLSGTI